MVSRFRVLRMRREREEAVVEVTRRETGGGHGERGVVEWSMVMVAMVSVESGREIDGGCEWMWRCVTLVRPR